MKAVVRVVSLISFAVLLVACAQSPVSQTGESVAAPLPVISAPAAPPSPTAPAAPPSRLPIVNDGSDIHADDDTPPVGLFAPIPDCDAKITTTVGLYADGIREWKEYAIQVCDLPFDSSRASLGIMLQSQRLGQGTHWTNLANNDNWRVIEYRMPKTAADFERLNTEGTMGIRWTLYVLEKGLPLLILQLPRDILNEILVFIAYPNGALEILPYTPSEQIAQKVLRAVRAVFKKNR